VHQPQYLPWPGFFHKVGKSECFVFLDTVQFKKGDFQNRNRIRRPNSWIWLTVPVRNKGRFKQKICEVEIDNKLNWQRKHLLSMRINYGRSPYFRDLEKFFEKVYNSSWKYLIDLNVYLIEFFLKYLEIDTPIYYESKLKTTRKSTERIIEICQKVGADTYLSGRGGKAYLDESKLKQAKIKVIYQEFKYPVYKQRFNDNFIPDLSIVDLIFNCGKKSKELIFKE
jgi:hypothetical protein